MSRTPSEIGKSNVRRSKAHELAVSKLLTAWSGQRFRRRIVTGREEDIIALESTGDVICLSNNSINFNIEAKSGKDFSFTALCNVPATAKFTEWYHQSVYDSTISTNSKGRKIHPLVFFRPSPTLNWVAISVEGLESLKSKDGSDVYKMPHLLFDYYKHTGKISHNVKHTRNKNNKEYVPLDLPPCVFCSWAAFADHINPESMFSLPCVIAETQQQ